MTGLQGVGLGTRAAVAAATFPRRPGCSPPAGASPSARLFAGASPRANLAGLAEDDAVRQVVRESLPPDDLRAFEAMYFDGLDPQEIAAELGLTLGALDRLIRRARRRLARVLTNGSRPDFPNPHERRRPDFD